MPRKSPLPSMDFYQDNAKLKWIILAVSILISISSIYYTNVLVEQLKESEKQQINLFAKALEYTLSDVANENIFFVTNEIMRPIIAQEKSAFNFR